MTFEQWAIEHGHDLAALTSEQTARLVAVYERQAKAKADQATADAAAGLVPLVKAADPVADHRQRYGDELKRTAAISARFAGKHPALMAQAVAEGWTEHRAEAAFWEAEVKDLRDKRPAASVGAGAAPGTGTADPDVVTAAMLLSLGVRPDVVAGQLPLSAREGVMNRATAAGMRGYSLHALMDDTILQSGGHYRGSRKSEAFAREAIAADRKLRATYDLQASGGFTTVSLSGVLSNVANKFMQAMYSAQNTTWEKWCAVRNHADFKPVVRYRLDGTGSFRKVGPDGELKHIGLVDTGYTNKIDTYGAIIALTRQMQINDDMGAFAEVPGVLARMAAVRVEEAAYALLLSNAGSFFSVGNKNLLSGAGSALAIDGLTAAETNFNNQVDVNGKPIFTAPGVLLVPTTLTVGANKLYRDTTLIAVGAGNAAAVASNANPHAGKYPPTTSPYLNNTAIRDQDGKPLTGQSDTAWFLFADPAVRAAVGVAFLNGQRVPTIESSETEFQTLGMSWRAYEDFGVGFEDPTAALKNAGA